MKRQATNLIDAEKLEKLIAMRAEMLNTVNICLDKFDKEFFELTGGNNGLSYTLNLSQASRRHRPIVRGCEVIDTVLTERNPAILGLEVRYNKLLIGNDE